VSGARDEILARVRAAQTGPALAVPREYRSTGGLDDDARLDLFCNRISDYRAKVVAVARDGIGAAVGDECAQRGARRLVIPAGLPADWCPADVDLIRDDELAPAELDALDGVITGCTVAIAETGTIALSGGPSEGRRAISLVPDLHICVVERRQIVELVPEAIRALGGAAQRRSPITLISGPSATSDIELSRVEGVHGPRHLVVIVSI
jgi:L-lactate dehydrogenase complex protein LldG